jgi:hypothetical protein
MPGVARLDAAAGQGLSGLFGCNRVHRPALTMAREHEALVALSRDLGAVHARAFVTRLMGPLLSADLRISGAPVAFKFTE